LGYWTRKVCKERKVSKPRLVSHSAVYDRCTGKNSFSILYSQHDSEPTKIPRIYEQREERRREEAERQRQESAGIEALLSQVLSMEKKKTALNANGKEVA
jgi:hypothetical protein